MASASTNYAGIICQNLAAACKQKMGPAIAGHMIKPQPQPYNAMNRLNTHYAFYFILSIIKGTHV